MSRSNFGPGMKPTQLVQMASCEQRMLAEHLLWVVELDPQTRKMMP